LNGILEEAMEELLVGTESQAKVGQAAKVENHANGRSYLPVGILNGALTKLREEHLGYNFTCTPDCVGIGRDNRQMRRMLEWGRPSREL
jgi:hypothetical protein